MVVKTTASMTASKPILTPLADEILKRVPLIKNPLFQTPKSITLNNNYNQLLPKLSNSKPPKINLSSQDLENWISDIEKLKKDYEKHDDTYTQWLKQQKLMIAPGLDSIITPTHKEIKEDHTNDVNDLDKIFGKARIE